MLRSLHIENIAVARRLDIEFDSGFTVMTGETGAGKSVIVDCLALITGGKAQREMLRSGEERAIVSAVFSELSSNGIWAAADLSPDENGELEVVRTLSSDGRGTVKINRRTVPLSVLRDIGPYLISIQSQNEAHNLLDKAFHRSMLDAYAGIEALLTDYAIPYSRYTALLAEKENLRTSLREKNMMSDILKYQIKEIDAAKLNDPGEEDKLVTARAKIRNMERIAKYSGFVYRALAQSDRGASASVLMQKSAAALRQLSDVMPEAEQLAARLENYRYEIEDIGETARALLDGSDISDPDKQLNLVEGRLSQIERLKRKYGGTIQEIQEFRRDAARKLADLEAGDEKLDELEHELHALRRELGSKAAAISDRRRAAADELSRAVCATLSYLDMPKVRFIVEILKMSDGGEERFGSYGSDDITFLIATNPGEPPMPLGKIASGGEMSRVMLALCSVMNRSSGADTVVFDEIDAGVSGGTSERIGRKLKETSETTQVICVTHSPQIASLADRHLRIGKQLSDGRAESVVTELDASGRVAEIARIIGGIDITETQREAAREMLQH